MTVAISTPAPSIVTPEQVEDLEREDRAIRLLEAAAELRAVWDALGGIRSDMSSDRASLDGLRLIVGRSMNAVADIAVEIAPEVVEAFQN